MSAAPLTNEQKVLVAEIAELILRLKQWETHKKADVRRWQDDVAKKAHQLHMELKAAGVEPKHHRYMIENRGVPPTDPEFYRHIHPAEDLLKFVQDIHANDDPEDQTIGSDLKFRLFARRWGHDDTYTIKRTADGWWIGHLAIAGDCDKAGNPFLYENFRQDGINYPADLPSYFEWLWQQAAEEGLTKVQVQRGLDQLARWVSVCEQNTPGGIFEGYSGPAVTADA
jgi:hypothetical protein